MNDYVSRLGDDTFAIFLFHGIYWRKTWNIRNSSGKHLEYLRFRDIVCSLKREGRPISMDQILSYDIPPRAFAITFDDGFASSYWLGASYLEELGIPATFYITTGFVDNDTDSWVDQIEQVAEIYNIPLKAVVGIKDYGKHSGYDQYGISEFVKTQTGEGRRDPQLDQKMTKGMVMDLFRNPLFSIGGHSITHRNLEYLPFDVARQEIAKSTGRIWDWTGAWSPHYSYPEGMPGCNTPSIVDCLKNHSIKICPTAQDGVNRKGDDLFALKRIMVV